jgi:lactoylglutathione lyase
MVTGVADQILGSHHTGFTVSSLERSLSFYLGLLGGELVVEAAPPPGGYIAELLGYQEARVRLVQVRLPGSSHLLELMEIEEPPGIAVPVEPRRIGCAHLCIVVADLPDTWRRLRAAGVRFVSEPVQMTGGANPGGWGVYARDPDGIIVQLVQRARPSSAEPGD